MGSNWVTVQKPDTVPLEYTIARRLPLAMDINATAMIVLLVSGINIQVAPAQLSGIAVMVGLKRISKPPATAE